MRWLWIVLLCGCVNPSTQYRLQGSVPSVDSPAFTSALFQTTGARLSDGHRWELAQNGEVFDAIVADIGRAKASVDILTYIWQPGQPSDKIIDALGKRLATVACRVITDPVGSPDFEKAVAPRLEKVGCESHLFRPIGKGTPLPRDHRKIVVVDGKTGFVGGFGIRKDWVRGSGSSDPEWRDINVRVEGPTVNDLQRAFSQNWQEAGGALLGPQDFPVVPSEGTARMAFVTSTGAPLTDAERLMHLVFSSAKKRLWIWNAYFVPNDNVLELLAKRAREGVDVRILAPGDKNDVPVYKVRQRQTYAALHRAGIRIFEYQPTMMHAKTTLVDDRLAVVGSINLESLSLSELEEDALVVDDPALVTRLAKEWEKDMEKAKEITP